MLAGVWPALFCASLLVQGAASISCYVGLKTPKTAATPFEDSYAMTECGSGFDRCYELCTSWKPEVGDDTFFASDAGCGNRELCEKIHKVGGVGAETVDDVFWVTKFDCCEGPNCNVGCKGSTQEFGSSETIE